MKPLCIDLFCGLSQAKFFGGADSFVEQLVARRAQDPDHVGLGVFHFQPRAISLKPRPVRKFQNSTLAAGLAGLRELGILPANPQNYTRIIVGASRVVNGRHSWVSIPESIPALLGSLYGAIVGAISAVAIGWLYREVSSAGFAIATGFCGIGLFSPAQSPHTGLAPERTVHLINPACRKFGVTTAARQDVQHSSILYET